MLETICNRPSLRASASSSCTDGGGGILLVPLPDCPLLLAVVDSWHAAVVYAARNCNAERTPSGEIIPLLILAATSPPTV